MWSGSWISYYFTQNNTYTMEQYVYVESTKSMAFQWIKFENKDKAEAFCKNLMASCKTLKAKLV